MLSQPKPNNMECLILLSIFISHFEPQKNNEPFKNMIHWNVYEPLLPAICFLCTKKFSFKKTIEMECAFEHTHTHQIFIA